MITSENYDGTQCPRCESEKISGQLEPEGSCSAFRRCLCDDCGAEWTEIFELHGYDNLSKR